MTDGLLNANERERKEYIEARGEFTQLLNEGSLGSARDMLDHDKRLNGIYELAKENE